MGFLERIGMLQEEESPSPGSPTQSAPIGFSAQVEIPTVGSVEQLYKDLNLPVNQGVFQLQAYMATMPVALTDAQKVETVKGIVAATGSDYNVLIKDGQDRIQILKAAAAKSDGIYKDNVADATEAIDALKAEIERYQTEISSLSESNQKVQQEFKLEVDKITGIIAPFTVEGGSK